MQNIAAASSHQERIDGLTARHFHEAKGRGGGTSLYRPSAPTAPASGEWVAL